MDSVLVVPVQGMAYGFGTVNIARDILFGNDDQDFDLVPIFPGNTGTSRGGAIFAPNEQQGTIDNVNTVREGDTAPPDFVSDIIASMDLVTGAADESLPQTISISSDETIGEAEIAAVFSAEFGAGIVAPFLKPQDNIENVAVTVAPLPGFDLTENTSESVPEPATTLATGAFAAMMWYRRRQRQQAKN